MRRDPWGHMAAYSTAQDDARENRIVDLFNLMRPANRVRHGTDAILLIDGHELEFELKSVTRAKGSISTVRDLGPDHIEKWRNKHWIVALYDGSELLGCRYGSPDAMAPWIHQIWEYVRRDFELAQLLPARLGHAEMFRILGKKEIYSVDDARLLHKSQFTAATYRELMDVEGGYSADQMLEIMRERAKYLLERGSTLNNPHIPAKFVLSWPEITRDHAVTLRELVRAWLSSTPAGSLMQPDTP
jgi:hypothetical protein